MANQTIETFTCSLDLTANARNGIEKVLENTHAFFKSEETFHVHIEKRPVNRQGNRSYFIYFNNISNKNLAERLDERVAVMECVTKHDGFLAIGFHVRGKRTPVETNRRLSTSLKFLLEDGAGVTMPVELYTSLRELPVADERSEYVEKRISSWEGYLRIQERNADVEDITSTFTASNVTEDFSKLRLTCNGLKSKEWRMIQGFSAKLHAGNAEVGNVVQVNRSKQQIEIELTPKYRTLARRNEWHPQHHGKVTFNNFAELSQVRRLRRGFKDLQDGLAANPNLEKILFEERPVVRISKSNETFEFHNRLNKFQQEAVIGAMTSNDLYVIQGPPGTGKTTVISEICHQNVKKGLRTLVASQANLAVDNALGRLISQQDIRILRRGRTESIEEEGKRFIEENVAQLWKEETTDAIQQQVEQFEIERTSLENAKNEAMKNIEQMQAQLTVLDEAIEWKKYAQKKYDETSSALKIEENEVRKSEEKREQLKRQKSEWEKAQQSIEAEISSLQNKLEEDAVSEKLLSDIQKILLRIKQLEKKFTYKKVVQEIAATKESIEKAENEKVENESYLKVFTTLWKDLQSVKKMNDLQQCFHDAQVHLPNEIQQEMTELEAFMQPLKTTLQNGQFTAWKNVFERLNKAIQVIDATLQQHGFLNKSSGRNTSEHLQTPAAIQKLVTQIASYLVSPTTKQLLSTRNYSADKYEALERIAHARALLIDRRSFVERVSGGIHQFEQSIQQSQKWFSSIKDLSVQYVIRLGKEIRTVSNALDEKMEQDRKSLEHLQQERETASLSLGDAVDEIATVEEIQAQLIEAKNTLVSYEARKENMNQTEQLLKEKEKALEENEYKLQENEQTIDANELYLNSLGRNVEDLKGKLKNLAKQLEAQPEKEKEQVQAALSLEINHEKKLREDHERLPMKNALQKQWLKMLNEANGYDLNEIRKMYVEHANVIGTTCVASASRDFMEQYPTFDVVIIDEVSKATPPELLLPMLKGKKIILVGDHHQLPPLMGHDTLEELLEESEDFKEKKELEKLLKESLFERLFRTLPKQNKTMLGIQYRMHEQIMQTITPFYNEDGYMLQCGLADSNALRDHLLESEYVKRENHLLWFDMPNEPNYFEERVKGGTSRYNEAELRKIRKLLIDFDETVEKAKNAGLIDKEMKKSVGVISFYGEQVKRIDRLVEQELNLKHLHIRTGSVDKFQGMEMDVIIISFVRNHHNKNGDIGFARDYRRLNVALSRARELLIIVGSTDMFTKNVKDPRAKEMYTNLVKQVKAVDGFKTLSVTNS